MSKIYVQSFPEVLRYSGSLAAGASLSGSLPAAGYSQLVGYIYSSGSSETGSGLSIRQSVDGGVNWDINSGSFASETAFTASCTIDTLGNAFKIRYCNGATTAASVRMLFQLKPIAGTAQVSATTSTTSGSITVTSGSVSVTSGSVSVTSGSITVTSGSVSVTSGSILSTGSGTTISVTPTITAGSYSAKDCVGGVMTFANAVRVSGGQSILNTIVIQDNDDEKASLELWLFDSDPSGASNNDPMTFSDENLSKCVGVVPISVADYYSLANNGVACLRGVGLQFRCASMSLFGQLKCTSTPTYSASNDLTVKLGIEYIS